MKLDVNGLRLTGRRFGVGRYIEYLLRHWTELGGPFEGLQLFTPRALDDPIELPGFVEHRVLPTSRSNGYWEQAILPRRHRASDLLFCPSYVVPLAARGKVVVTHLGSYEALPSAFPLRERVKTRLLYQASARRADLVITVSESSKRDIVSFYGVPPEKVEVIPLGVEPSFRPLPDPRVHARVRVANVGSDRPLILFVGKLTRRRNIPHLIEAFARLRRESGVPHALLLIGANTAGHDLARLSAGHGVAHDVFHREFATHDELVEIYNAADVFVYPSSYEGFGIPVLEAMACGIPVVTLANSAFLEFASGAFLCRDGSPRELYAGMKEVLSSEPLRARLRENGLARSRDFLWEGIAARTMETLVGVAEA
jgi:glycosyltransferase involved in cell wall biosynthesis